MYFDTDARSLAGLSHHDFVKKFTELVCRVLLHGIGSATHICFQISHGKYTPDHQFILKPVTGEGRVSVRDMFRGMVA